MARSRRPTFNSKRFLNSLARNMAKAGRKKALPHIQSRTLRRYCTPEQRSSSSRKAVWAVTIPHYWAALHNDGTRGKTMPKGKFMWIFPNKRKDPRTSGGKDYAMRLVERRRLNWSSKRIKRAIKKKELVLARKVKGIPAQKFFDNDGGMRGFAKDASKIAQEMMSKEVRRFMGKDLYISLTGTLRM